MDNLKNAKTHLLYLTINKFISQFTMQGNHLFRHSFTENRTKLDTAASTAEESKGFFTWQRYRRIYLIEVDSNTDPCNVEIILSWNYEITKRHTQIINLSLYRAKFIYQKDKYILDTSEIDLFVIPEKGGRFTVEISTENPNQQFTVNVYFQLIPEPGD